MQMFAWATLPIEQKERATIQVCLLRVQHQQHMHVSIGLNMPGVCKQDDNNAP